MKKGLLLGIAIGDAVGVPYEFMSKEEMQKNPATDMVGFGTHNQPIGTWSDDTSLTLCLGESIGEGFDLEGLANKFIMWKFNNYMVAGSKVFDIGITTSRSIDNLRNRKFNQVKPENCGLSGYGNNGNGSVMRILPLAWYINKQMLEGRGYLTFMGRYNLVKKVSGLTHGHEISIIASHILIEFAVNIIQNKMNLSLENVWDKTRTSYAGFIQKYADNFNRSSLDHFKRILSPEFKNYNENDIHGSGFAVHTLEASIWCLMNTDNYESCVLKAVNLGHDTDTTGAVAGGLAGLVYGEDGIPQKWKNNILKRDLINEIECKMLKC